MNKTIIILGILLFSFFSCVPDPDPIPVQLDVPKNLQITVVGREMTVTWDAVKNASGYILYTTSVDCGSGNRIVNTVANTVRLHTGGQASGKIIDSTTFTLTLMAATGSQTEAMASSVTAKVMSVGYGEAYIDSGYSDVVTLGKADYD